MLTAERLESLIKLDKNGLVKLLANAGYTGASFKSAQFIGITNGGQLCYQVVYYDDAGIGEEVGKVFVTYDHVTNTIKADY
jgi:hypothetical protein